MAKVNKTADKIKPAPAVKTEGAGYPDSAKTSGIKTRGNGAATKGTMARGPMA